jgi:hypothetical protein
VLLRFPLPELAESESRWADSLQAAGSTLSRDNSLRAESTGSLPLQNPMLGLKVRQKGEELPVADWIPSPDRYRMAA